MKTLKIPIMLVNIFFILIILSTQVLPQSTTYYEGTDEIFLNPERGFTSYRSNVLTLTYINQVKASNVSVIQRLYTIPQYNKTPLPETFLDIVRNDLNTAREGGVKLVLRFAYTNNQNGADAALDTILLHIDQLTPVLQENYDVIVYVEAGFIGAWGEWYYSSHGNNNTASRKAVLEALLNALPTKRNVVIRTPDYKRKIFGIDTPLDFNEAFTGTFKSRTGAHNDCFLASYNDYGTYVNVEGDKNYLNLDNRFVPQGGETCCDCGYAGCTNALKDLARLHWSLINKDYEEHVMARWINEGCMDEIRRRLGYRFELLEATISDSIKPSGIINIDFKIENKGFASPFNPRNLEIILKDKSSNYKYRLITDEDPRLWFSGDTANVSLTAGIPSDMVEGEYGVYIFLADPEPDLHENPDYAIRLANTGLWEDSTGYNYLNHNLFISSNTPGDNYTGTKYFELYDKVSDVIDEEIVIPAEYKIDVYPNPFNSTTTIIFNIKPVDITAISIYDIMGRLIKDFKSHEYNNNRIIWRTEEDLSSGIYFFTIKTKENLFTNKIVYLK